MARQYYTLVASLPPLRHFDTIDVLPIGRERLDSRLGMLHADDARDLSTARALMDWQTQPAGRTDADLAVRYEAAVETTANRALRDVIEFRMSLRTAVAALRRRRRGEEAPTRGAAWGAGPLVPRITAKWKVADLGLGPAMSWVDTARQLMEKDDAFGLERLLLDLVWVQLRRTADAAPPFGFERVFSYVFLWDIVQRWLSYRSEDAAARFQELITEVTRDHTELFV